MYALVKGKGFALAPLALDWRVSMVAPNGRKDGDNMNTMSARIDNQTRKRVYARDGYRCALCDSTRYLQIHHVVPRGKGGPRDNEQNLVTLCADCHALAHGTNLRDFVDFDNPEQHVNQAIIEYMADLYACQGIVWNPWGKGKAWPP